MAIPTNKEELLKAICSQFEKLHGLLGQLPSDSSNLPTMDGHRKGSKITVKDLVAYLLGWNKLVLKWLDFDAKGQPIDFPETGFKWNELGRLAERFYADYENVPLGTLIAELNNAKIQIIDEIEKRSNAELYGNQWYGKWTMGRMIQFNTSSPYSNAYNRLRKWKRNLQT